MRITDLNPRWFAEEGRHGQGLTFECPHCRTVRLGVAFTPPLDGGANIDLRPGSCWPALASVKDADKSTVPPGIHWQRGGDTFETLSLSPSVDCSASGHWHGFVSNGEIR